MPVHPTAIFRDTGEFGARLAAERACKAAGFSIGPSQDRAPTGMMFGNAVIAKWRNMSRQDQNRLHGQIWGGRDPRVTVMLHGDAPPAAVEAFQQVLAAAEREGTIIEPIKALQGTLLLLIPIVIILIGALGMTP